MHTIAAATKAGKSLKSGIEIVDMRISSCFKDQQWSGIIFASFLAKLLIDQLATIIAKCNFVGDNIIFNLVIGTVHSIFTCIHYNSC